MINSKIEDIAELVAGYERWLKEKTTLRQVNEWVEVTTPFLDRHNDHLQIYVSQRDGHYKLTDDGYIIEDLKMSGCHLDTAKRKEILESTLRGFGVRLVKDALEIETSPEHFAPAKHNLIQAMLAVNDMFFLAQSVVTSLFVEDITGWFDEHDIRYISSPHFKGKSGYDHTFDFAIPKSKSEPERLIKAMNSPRKDAAQNIAFAWMDTRETRSATSKAYAMVNDREGQPNPSIIDALRNYSVEPILWSQKDAFIGQLAN